MTYLLADYHHGESSDQKIIAFLRAVKPKRVAIEDSPGLNSPWSRLSKSLRREGIRFFPIDSPTGSIRGHRLHQSYMDRVVDDGSAGENIKNTLKAIYLLKKISDARTKIMIQKLERLEKQNKFPEVIVVGAGHAIAIGKRFGIKIIPINKSWKNPISLVSDRVIRLVGNRLRKKAKLKKRLQTQKLRRK